MSFLDDLKKEAQQVKKAEDATRDAEELQRQAIIGAVRPRLRKVYDYFKDTCDQLTVVDPDIYMSYEIRGFGKLGPLRQGEYRVNAENPDTMDKFNVFFSCSRPDQVRFKLPGKETVAAQKSSCGVATYALTPRSMRTATEHSPWRPTFRLPSSSRLTTKTSVSSLPFVIWTP